MVERLFLSRGGGSQVDILDPSDGSKLGDLNTSDVAGGASRDLQDIEVTADGVIIACNEVNNFYARGTVKDFKCYRWDHLNDNATEILSFTPPDQDGDGDKDHVGRTIGIYGEASDNSLTILTAASTLQSPGPLDNVYRFETSDNGMTFSQSTVDRTGDESTAGLNGVVPLGAGSSQFVYNAGGVAPKLYSGDGTYQEDLSGATSLSAFTNTTRYLQVGSKEYLVAFNYATGNGSHASVVDITQGFSSAIDYGKTPSLGDGAGNGAGDVDFQTSSDGTTTFYVVANGDGLAAYTTTSALPVEMASFQATTTSSDAVQLTWTTASETNNAGFRVQRQTEGGSWTQVGFVDSKADGGSTTATQQYRFAVENGLAPGTHRFRLEQVDLDGTTHLSDVVSAEVQMQSALELTAPSPNPVTGSATLSFAVKNTTDATLTLYNVLGQKVRTLYTGTPTAGEAQTVRLSADGLTSGTYLLRLQANGATKTTKVTVLR